MPGERHVFDPLLAGILNQRERQGVWAGAAKLVDARAVAAFRGVAARFLDCDSIPGCCNIAPNVALRINDIEAVVRFDRPDGAERVSPSADQRPLRAGRIRRARIREQEKNASQKNSQRRLSFHAFHPVGS